MNICVVFISSVKCLYYLFEYLFIFSILPKLNSFTFLFIFWKSIFLNIGIISNSNKNKFKYEGNTFRNYEKQVCNIS